MLRILKIWARRLIRDVHAVYLAARDPRVPWYARVLAIAVAGYALSPIDLIPDFIPVIGYADDLIIVPLGIWLVVSLIPTEVMAEYRVRAIEAGQRPPSKIAAIVIITIWILWRPCWSGSGVGIGANDRRAVDCRRASAAGSAAGFCRPEISRR